MLVLSRRVRHESLARNNLLVFDLADGGRVRLWLVQKRLPDGRAAQDEVKCLIKAPPTVKVRRGEHLSDGEVSGEPEPANVG